MINLNQFSTTAKRGVTCLALVAMVGLSACDEAITLAPGAVDANDNCGQFQKAIAEARQKSNQLRIENAAAGALAGALIGAAIAGSDNRAQGALIGGILGGATAAGATAQQQKTKREADAAILREVNTKAGSANQLFTEAGRAANSLRSCRLNQISALERSVRNGSVSTDGARSQLRVLKRRAAVDNQIISASFNGIGRRVDSFVNTGARNAGVEQAILTRQAPAQNTASRTARNATPNVVRAKNTQAQLIAADQRKQASVDRGLDSIEALLG